MLLEPEFLSRLEYLSLISRRVFRGQLLAQRRTKQLGGGIEFADHREYSPGDDLRYVDWQIYARHGDVLLKRFQEEEDLHVYILLDVSPSMSMGHPSKFDYARQIAAAMGYIALADLDRVSVLAYADAVRSWQPLTRGKDQVLGVLKFLDRLESGGNRTDLAAVARTLMHRAPRTGLVLIISDLYDQDGFRRGVDLLRHRRFEPHLIQIHTSEEGSPKLLGEIELEDIETGEERKVIITERRLQEYRERFQEFLKNIAVYCRSYGLSFTHSTTDVPFDQLILRMMRTAGVTS
jgi:uncharacterized protein (DUF58 family)